MRKPAKNFLLLFTVCLFIFSGTSCQSANEVSKLYYSIESEGVVYGYVESTSRSTEKDGITLITESTRVRSISSALGMNIDTKVKAQYTVDPETGYFSDIEKCYR